MVSEPGVASELARLAATYPGLFSLAPSGQGRRAVEPGVNAGPIRKRSAVNGAEVIGSASD
jgi:hypothetical protein